MYCKRCGKEIENRSYCTQCGTYNEMNVKKQVFKAQDFIVLGLSIFSLILTCAPQNIVIIIVGTVLSIGSIIYSSYLMKLNKNDINIFCLIMSSLSLLASLCWIYCILQ